uniref:Uncharacterized protein n=1 Tax=Strigamia maritima TaxID=126957 RepID=T1J9U0_STRMM
MSEEEESYSSEEEEEVPVKVARVRLLNRLKLR